MGGSGLVGGGLPAWHSMQHPMGGVNLLSSPAFFFAARAHFWAFAWRLPRAPGLAINLSRNCSQAQRWPSGIALVGWRPPMEMMRGSLIGMGVDLAREE